MMKIERVDAAVAGRDVDRPPVAAWRHFLDRESNAADLAAAMVEWQREYDWDFLKINPRATYAVEAWQGRPGRIERLDPGAGPFGEQLDAIARIRHELGDEVYAIQTIFSPLAYATTLAAGDEALEPIADTLADYARECLRAGASGLFFASTKAVRGHEERARPYDLRVLEAVRDAPFNVLHVCGEGVRLEEFADYPVHAVNWDVLAPGNPSLAEGKQVVPFAVAGALAEAGTLSTGTPEEVTRLVRDAIESTGGRRMIVAPGCSAKPPQSAPNLRALRAAVGG